MELEQFFLLSVCLSRSYRWPFKVFFCKTFHTALSSFSNCYVNMSSFSLTVTHRGVLWVLWRLFILRQGLPVQCRLTSSLESFCPSLPSVGITEVRHHACSLWHFQQYCSSQHRMSKGTQWVMQAGLGHMWGVMGYLERCIRTAHRLFYSYLCLLSWGSLCMPQPWRTTGNHRHWEQEITLAFWLWELHMSHQGDFYFWHHRALQKLQILSWVWRLWPVILSAFEDETGELPWVPGQLGLHSET